MNHSVEFKSWFCSVTDHSVPHDWQVELGMNEVCRNRMIRIATGLGKTEGILCAWLFHRVVRGDDHWPRRLIWCLPMRTLVDQTEHVARVLVEHIPVKQRPEVYVLMGGEDMGQWYLYPEKPAILIGTQDMLLSRALNRGYASARARWPMEFGLLNHDSLWVIDEVQLMDVGLATTAQLQAFRQEDGQKNLRPCYTWWMSATLQPDWLKSADTAEYHEAWICDPCTVPHSQRSSSVWDIRKTLALAEIDRNNSTSFAKQILEEHDAMPLGDYGRITLVVCNTVERACDTFSALQAAGRVDGVELVHSRFRQAERDRWRERFLNKKACTKGTDRIIVATQVVEAGIDITAGCLITELAPWSNLIQRFGRCARYGGSGKVLVVNRGKDEKSTAPYPKDDLASAWESLQHLQDVGISSLESFEESLDSGARKRLYPYQPLHLLLRSEFDELFDTTPDLTGSDLDISRFIRSGDERDLQVFWIDLEKSSIPPEDRKPQRFELCAIPFLKARNWLCGEETEKDRKPRLRNGMKAWVWDWIDGRWTEANRASLVPGRIVCVAADCGGYQLDRGFDASSRIVVTTVPTSPIPREVKISDESDSHHDCEAMSLNEWKTIGFHCLEVANVVREIAETVSLQPELQDILALAGIWHDIGKAHPAFQGAICLEDRAFRHDIAKAPEHAWLQPRGTYRYRGDSETRPAFRHELASALALFAVLEAYQPRHSGLLGPWAEIFAKIGYQATDHPTDLRPPQSVIPIIECSSEMFDLLIYLVASHHGKVRAALHASPKDQEYRDRDGRGLPIRGVREGDELPSIEMAGSNTPLPPLRLTLEPATLGLSSRTGASWRERHIMVLKRYGPTALAYLEALLRAADVRASRLNTPDPALFKEASA